MLIFGIILGVAAGAGSFIMGYIDDYIGPKKMIQISNFLLLIATIIVVFVNDETFFWIAGILVGFASGPNQSSSRSLMSKLCPKDKENEFFGFFAFSGKITAFFRTVFTCASNNALIKILQCIFYRSSKVWKNVSSINIANYWKY